MIKIMAKTKLDLADLFTRKTHRSFFGFFSLLNKTKIIFSLFVMLLGLSSCFNTRVEAQVMIYVEPTGAGTFSAALGMSRDLRNLLGSQGEDPMLAFTRSISSETDIVSLREWTDGELEWVEASFPFSSLRELNKRLENNELISEFSLTKQKTLTKDRFVLNAVINPIVEETDESGLDPSSFLDFRIIAILPGELVETNGLFDVNSGGVSWSINGRDQQTLYAMTEKKSWVNLSILLIPTLLFVGIIGLGSIVFFAIWLNKKGRLIKR
jgi:hypothetical protein